MPGFIVHEWIEASGGSEQVLDHLAMMYPDAGMFTLWNDVPNRYAGRDVQESWMASTPIRRSKIAALPLMPPTWRGIRTAQSYDWILASSHLFAHHVQLRGPSADVPKYVYAHTPARYLWAPELDTRGRLPGVKAAASVLRPLDRRRAGEARAVAANSEFIRQRIASAWDRDAVVIHPPVRVEALIQKDDWRDQLEGPELTVLVGLPDMFILGASRFVGYKRLDRVIDMGELVGLPVVIAGGGPEEAELRRRAATASIPVHFVIRPSDALLAQLYRSAAVFGFPPVEDFGLMPVEAQAAGTPALVNTRGGAGESVVHGVTGAVVDIDSDEEVRAGLELALGLSAESCRARARDFSPDVFVQKIHAFVDAA